MKLPLVVPSNSSLRQGLRSSSALAARIVLFFVLVIVGGAATLDCGPARGPADPGQSANDKAVIEGKDLACVMGSLISDSKELQAICKFADAVLPFVQGLIGVRDAARRSGVSYVPPANPSAGDGGPPSSAAKAAPDQGAAKAAPASGK